MPKVVPGARWKGTGRGSIGGNEELEGVGKDPKNMGREKKERFIVHPESPFSYRDHQFAYQKKS